MSDSSLNYDRTVKLPIYADSGIPVYFIVNLKERVVEAYSEPQENGGRYLKVERLAEGESVRIPATHGKGLEIPARKLLP